MRPSPLPFGLILISICLGGCKHKAGSALKGLALQEKPQDRSKNIALIIGAEGAGKKFLKGVAVDVDAYNSAFSQPDLGFAVRLFTEPSSDRPKTKTTKTYSDLLVEIGKAAKDVGDSGTLVVVFSGHGQQSTGSWYYDGDARSFQDIFSPVMTEVTRKNGIKLARGIIISDSCFSGNLIGNTGAIPAKPSIRYSRSRTTLRSPDGYRKDGRANLGESPEAATTRDQIVEAIGGAPLGGKGVGQNFNSMFGESIVITASASHLEAIDDGNNGGLFSGTLLKELSASRQDASLLTIRKLLNATIKQIEDRNDMEETLPSYAAFPESVLDDYVFKSGKESYEIGDRDIYKTQNLKGVCDRDMIVEWAPGFGKNKDGVCLNPRAFCQCAIYQTSCAIYPTGTISPKGSDPILYRPTLRDEGDYGCNKSCDVLVQANWNSFVRNCNGRTRMYTGRDEENSKKMQFFQYAWSERDGAPVRIAQYPTDPTGPVPDQIQVGKQ